jgi:hypothetical protein
LYFQFLENQETNNLVAQATLYLYVHSDKWWRSSKHSPKNIKMIDIEISKVLNGPYKEIVEVFRNITIPDINENGHYIQLNITNMVGEWFANHNMTHGMAVKVTTSNGTISSHSLQKIVSLDPSSQTVSSFISLPAYVLYVMPCLHLLLYSLVLIGSFPP